MRVLINTSFLAYLVFAAANAFGQLSITTTSSSDYKQSPESALYPAYVDGTKYQSWTMEGAKPHFQLVAKGGKEPLTWQITKGALPAGLKLGKDGKLSGTPQKEGTSSFSVKVTDANGKSAAKTLSMVSKPYRSKWFADARFGIMIQWGPFTEPILSTKAEIPVFENRIKAFDADKWAQSVADMGGKVLNFTVKAGDGIRLWPSKTPTKFELKTTRNIVGELITACHKRNIKFIAYIAPDHTWNKKVNDVAKSDETWGTLNKGIVKELLEMGVDGFWVDMGATPELYPNMDPKWFPWDEIIPMIRSTNPDAIFANNPGLGNGGTVLRWPNTDVIVYEGRMDVGEDALAVAKPAIVPKKIAIEVDNLLDKEWAWLPSKGPAKPKSASLIIKNIKANWNVGATYMLNYPVIPDGNIRPDIYAGALKEIGDFVKSNRRKVIATSKSVRSARTAYVPNKAARSMATVKAGPSSSRKESSYSYRGMKVTVKGRDLVLEGIGRKSVQGNNASHDILVKRFNDDYPVLQSSINTASAKLQSDGYQYAGTSGLTLKKGQTYIILAKEGGNDSFEANPISTPVVNEDLSIVSHFILNEHGDRRPVKDDGQGQILNLKYSPAAGKGPANIALGAQGLLLNNKDQALKPVRNVMYASNAVDGDKSTRAQAGGSYAWTLGLDLGSIHNAVNRCNVTFGENAFATDFELLTSVDGKNWQKTASKQGNNALEVSLTFPSTKVRYLKLRSLKPDGPNQPGNQMAVMEIEVFEGK